MQTFSEFAASGKNDTDLVGATAWIVDGLFGRVSQHQPSGALSCTITLTITLSARERSVPADMAVSPMHPVHLDHHALLRPREISAPAARRIQVECPLVLTHAAHCQPC